MNSIKIPKELHSTELLCFLYPNNYDTDEEKQAIELLHRICAANLADYHNINLIKDLKLTAEEKSIVLQNEWSDSENIEVKARCNDILCRFQKQDKRQIIADTSDCYLDAYSEFGEKEFLIRAITARNIKVLNDDRFLLNILSELNKIYDNPFQLNLLVVALKKSYPIEKINAIIPIIEKHRNDSALEQDFFQERQYLDILRELKAFNDDEYHKEKALSFENEADNIVNNKQDNTIYPTIPDIYQNAYNEIFKVKNKEPIVFKRIKEKLIKEKQDFVEFLSLYGIKMKMSIPDDFKQQVKGQIKKIRLNIFYDVIQWFLSVPFTPKSEIEKYEVASRKGSPISSFFGNEHLDSKGNTIGNKDPQESLRTEAHVYFRHRTLYALVSYFGLHHWAQIKTDEAVLFYLLKEKRPLFIDEDNVVFWAKGFCAGLNGDLITATHVLMPQLEHILLNIAEIKHGNITTLERKRQESPTLSGILSKLETVIEDEILFEISSFLQSGIDVNFRNNLAHGLFTPFEIEKYGIYLLWICLKLYFDKSIIMDKSLKL